MNWTKIIGTAIGMGIYLFIAIYVSVLPVEEYGNAAQKTGATMFAWLGVVIMCYWIYENRKSFKS